MSADGLCDRHRKARMAEADRARDPTVRRLYDHRWRKVARAYLDANPVCVCEVCVQLDRTLPSQVVDHIVPHRGDVSLFWSQANWQAMSKACHDRKTAIEDGGFGAWRRESLSRPFWMPRPNADVVLVLGPPGSGKSTLIREAMQAGDQVVDVNGIAAQLSGQPEHGWDRARWLVPVLRERNRRIAALEHSAAGRTWIAMSPSKPADERWWIDRLKPKRIERLATDRATCEGRIQARGGDINGAMRAIATWFENRKIEAETEAARG